MREEHDANFNISKALHTICVEINRLNKIVDKLEEWLRDNTSHISLNLETGKESWTNEIDMVFSSHKPTISMFRKRGVFVFDCNQEE